MLVLTLLFSNEKIIYSRDKSCADVTIGFNSAKFSLDKGGQSFMPAYIHPCFVVARANQPYHLPVTYDSTVWHCELLTRTTLLFFFFSLTLKI